MIAKVAVDNAAFSFDDAFDYAIPEKLKNEVRPGVRVLVPFGNSSKKRQGVVFALRENSEAKKLKNISAVLDSAPLLNNEMLRLAVWLKEECFCTLFEAAKAMLPTGLGLNLITSYLANPDASPAQISALSADENSVYTYLCDKSVYVNKEKLLHDLGFKPDFPIAEQMADKGILLRNIDSVRKIGDATIKMVRLSELYLSLPEIPKFTLKQKQVIKLLEDIGSASVKEVCYFTGVTTAVVATLEKKGYLEFFDNQVFRRPRFDAPLMRNAEICLTDEQNTAYQKMFGQYKSGKACGSLLFGITGSGKTQVYIKLIDDVIESGSGVIVMVPEISLTPQLLELFYGRYGSAVAVFHSALSMGERLDEWKRIKQGEAKIAIGTRSAVFAPFDKLGLIIMDEEQEHTYKSEMSPRYHARDVAKFRTNFHNALLVLASATPSLETYSAAKRGRYSLCTLQNRYGKAVLPEVITTNMKYGADLAQNKNLSEELLCALKNTFADKKQAILLLNRRGYNTFAACSSCGKVMVCPNCSISMTYHSKNGRLMCHYCGFSESFTQVCRACGEKSVVYTGTGTQKLEEELAESFPDARILRLDTDTTASRYSFQNALKKFTNYEYDIMVGTQMVAKGLDFPNVTLVGVISIDQQLYNDDYKSAERAFDLLTQVIGRAGRGNYQGKAIIQTSFPENEIIRLSAQQDYEAFYALEMQMRKAMVYPPYCDICVFAFVGTDELKTKAASKFMLDILKEKHRSEYQDLNIMVLGPIAPRLSKISGKYRYRIIVKCRNSKRLRQFVAALLKAFSKDSRFTKISAFADLNPENIY